MLGFALSVFLWVERPIDIPNPKQLPEIVENQKIYRKVSLDEYSAFVRDKEMPTNFPEEARKAQEILARTFYIQNHRTFVDSTDMYQVFNFKNFIKPYEPLKILTGIKNIQYHSRCPGFTMVNGQKIPCPLHQNNPYVWTYKINSSDFGLKEAVRKIVSTNDLSLKQKLRIPFREKIKSIFIDQFDSQSGLVTGRGYGHGSGMCQWGAKYMAEKGYTYNQILSYYYPGSMIKVLQ